MKAQKRVTQKRKYPSKFTTILEIHCPKLQRDFICNHCLRPIQKNERIAILGTFDVKEILENKGKVKEIKAGYVSEYFYHLGCYKAYFNQEINACVQNMQKELFNNPAIKQAMSLVDGLMTK